MEKKKIFFISPLGEKGTEIRNHFNTVKTIIKNCALELSYELKSPNLTDCPIDIDTQILNLLDKSDIVIADIAFNNPNVFFELTIRLALNKPLIVIQSHEMTIPFDIKHFSIIRFDKNNPDEWDTAQMEIISQIRFFEENNEKMKLNNIAELIINSHFEEYSAKLLSK